MKEKLRRLLATLLSAMMLFSGMPMTALAEEIGQELKPLVINSNSFSLGG